MNFRTERLNPRLRFFQVLLQNVEFSDRNLSNYTTRILLYEKISKNILFNDTDSC